MLELINIKKEYPAGDTTVHALKGVSLKFRKSEFVSILGPSGCGKTTMLNIIGGLDKYTSGDLVINGRSTKDYKARDWDTYRNHSIGFVFQSYNLIPHQTVLQNVEIALTLSGVSKSERRRRAKEALEKVGLGNQLKKRPSEMSGGQVQRVAIARAIVNNPDIILADEPTGALDTETSVQVMDILKEIAKDRLVIMVTHNPELAEKYSTRIVRMLDGEIKDDTCPLSEEESEKELNEAIEKTKAEGKQKKPSMSIFTSFGLSLKNLFTKRGRTILTSFAGSIGIIGIALIFSVSQGMTTYINEVQEETLSSYPITIEETHVDLASLIQSFMDVAESDTTHGKDAVYEKNMIFSLVDSLSNMDTETNDLKAFKAYIESRDNDLSDPLSSALSGLSYSYSLKMPIYTKTVDGNIIETDSTKLMQKIMAEYMGSTYSQNQNNNGNSGNRSNRNGFMSMMTGTPQSSQYGRLWQEMLKGDDEELVNNVVKQQYDLVYGSWPENYNEIVLVLDQNNELSDLSLYALGILSNDTVDEIMEASKNGESIKSSDRSWSYEDICEREYITVLPANCYVYDELSGTYHDLRETDSGIQYLYSNGIPLKVSGIIRLKEDALAGMITGSIGYTYKLTEYIINESQDAESVKAQKENEGYDIFTGLPFKQNADTLSDKEKSDYFVEYIGDMNMAEKALTYVKIKSIPSDEELSAMTDNAMQAYNADTAREALKETMIAQLSLSESDVSAYLDSMSDDDVISLFRQGVEEQVKAQYAAGVAEQLSAMEPEQLAGALDMEISTFSDEYNAKLYELIIEFSDTDYENNLKKLGCLDLETPVTINLYASSFENKDLIEDAIKEYNKTVDEVKKISYTDYVGLMMSSVTTIINAITYVLIAFVAISLVVSSIMIGVITLISVQERTKEIGILRAIGASKRNVSSMFNAETVIIGFTSGLLGVIITYLLGIPINAILHNLTGINNLSTEFPISVAAILVGISMLLTLIAGVIPSRSAAKKDPVEALRSE